MYVCIEQALSLHEEQHAHQCCKWLRRAVWSCSMPLDVMRVDTGDGSHRMSVCYATYGYMGDLLRMSEAMR